MTVAVYGDATTVPSQKQDHADEILYVYPSRSIPDGWWSPRYGDLTLPKGWNLLPPGDAFVTRQVKSMGPHWIAKKYVRGKEYSITLGVLAPRTNITKAKELAEQTKEEREARRLLLRKERERKNLDYTKKFMQTVIEYLDFDPKYSKLATKIAREAAERATLVGSGRVGRTNKLTFEEKARLAARAYIRHKYTNYEEEMIKAEIDAFSDRLDREIYGEIKGQAEREVDEFLSKHRAPLSKEPTLSIGHDDAAPHGHFKHGSVVSEQPNES
jgi:hypothetical protein